jgi:hypothetical protein
MIRCPKCNYFKVATEKRPDGNSKCIACQYEAPTKEFDVKNWDWIYQETQTQLDKLKSLMSVQLDMLEQNKQMSAEIEQLKSRLLNFEGMTFSENAEIVQLKSDLRMSELNRQSLWSDSLKLTDENALLRSKLKVAVDTLINLKAWGYKTQWETIDKALSDVGKL